MSLPRSSSSIGCGYLLGRRRSIDPAPLADVAMYICLPFLLFSALVRHPVTGAAATQALAWQVGMYLVSMPAIALVAHLAGWDKTHPQRGHPLPPHGQHRLLWRARSALRLWRRGPSNRHAALCVRCLGRVARHLHCRWGAAKPAASGFKSIFRLPLIYTAALALAVNALAAPIPTAVLDAADLIGRAGPILAIVLLGIQVGAHPPSAAAARLPCNGGIGAKVLLGPAIGIGLTLLIGAQGAVRDVLLLCSCLPTAINALILTVRFDARPDLLGGILIGSTLWSPLGLSIVLYWIGISG